MKSEIVIEIEPIGVVEAARARVEDDYWGGAESGVFAEGGSPSVGVVE